MNGSVQIVVLACGLGAAVCCAVAPAWAADETTIFAPPAPAGAPAANAGDADLAALQLSGVSTLGGTTMFNFVDSRTNRSFWIPLKGSANGFSVVSYDEQTNAVVVDRQGQRRSVPMRQAQIAAMPSPSVVPAAVQVPVRAPSGMPATVVRTADGGEIVNPKTPQEIAQAETEARMMVSDLLEISMRERARQKALREAQQQPQGGGPAPAQPAQP